MRWLAPTVLLALLAACTVTTTGAPCSSDLNCPTSQGCGSDRLCSTAALSCPGHGTDGECTPGRSCVAGQLVTCTAAGGVCSTQTEAACSDPGETCVAAGGNAACVCPTLNACTQVDATRCNAGGDQVLVCKPVVAGSACLSWQTETNCASSSLVCSAGACACPANPGPIFHADAEGGSGAGAIPSPTGAAAPAACRFKSLTVALAAANALGSGATAKAAGWSAATPGGVMLFSEPGALSIGAGVTLTTDDPSPTTSHYAVTTAATLAVPFVSIGPGGSLSGFEIRDAASSGAGVQTACLAAADTASVSVSTVRIVAASGGTPIVRFGSGVQVTGYCPVSMTNVTVDGAATGILVESAPLVESTATAAHVTGSTVVGVSVLEGKISFTGGLLDLNAEGVSIGATGAGAPSFSATGTTFSGNTGDAIYVGRGTLFCDGCPFVNNGTHVHAQPVGGAAVNVTVQNSTGAAKMSGATNSAFRLLAMGSGSTVVLTGNSVSGNDATQSYNVATGMRRGGGVILTAPFPGSATIRGNAFFGNKWDQLLVAAGTGTLDLSGDALCGAGANSFGCYDSVSPSVGIYSNGAAILADWNHWTVQPGVYGIDVAGSGVTGFDTRACSASAFTCQ